LIDQGRLAVSTTFSGACVAVEGFPTVAVTVTVTADASGIGSRVRGTFGRRTSVRRFFGPCIFIAVAVTVTAGARAAVASSASVEVPFRASVDVPISIAIAGVSVPDAHRTRVVAVAARAIVHITCVIVDDGGARARHHQREHDERC